MPLNRRDFITRTATAAMVANPLSQVAEAAATKPNTLLSTREWQLITHLGEAIVPGSEAAGLTEFISRQLSKPAHQALLMVRYLGLPLSPQQLYQQLAEQLKNYSDNHSLATDLSDKEQAKQLAEAMADDSVANWQGLPASLYHFILRSDGCDVVYGTPAGSRLLELDYMPHITPPEFL
ncbi:MAG: gluconate 2-dehydrogenase subunit 3 family protein [Porticoccaceae bacterium]